jgi:hypothetical protein
MSRTEIDREAILKAEGIRHLDKDVRTIALV